MADSCSSCRFFVLENGGECHFGPPKVFVFQVMKQGAHKELTVMRDRIRVEVDYQTFSAWPSIPSSQWCGSHEPKETQK